MVGALSGPVTGDRLGVQARGSCLILAGELAPLVWPEHFPPADWWGRFFTGIPPLGPSVAFFHRLELQQALRAVPALNRWTNTRHRQVALRLGEALRMLGWRTPYFIPADQVVAIIGGPSFNAFAQQDLEYLLDEFNRQLGRRLKPEFLRSVIEWNDARTRFGELVEKVTAQLDLQAAEAARAPGGYRVLAPLWISPNNSSRRRP